jgi:hypothetical protein
MTRLEAAQAIAEKINENEIHGARVWSSPDGGSVRIYLKLDAQSRKGWIDNGFINFAKSGKIEVNATRQAGALKDAVREFEANNQIGAVAPASAPVEIEEENDFVPVRDVYGDERGY